jgi:hypothetical protein
VIEQDWIMPDLVFAGHAFLIAVGRHAFHESSPGIARMGKLFVEIVTGVGALLHGTAADGTVRRVTPP